MSVSIAKLWQAEPDPSGDFAEAVQTLLAQQGVDHAMHAALQHLTPSQRGPFVRDLRDMASISVYDCKIQQPNGIKDAIIACKLFGIPVHGDPASIQRLSSASGRRKLVLAMEQAGLFPDAQLSLAPGMMPIHTATYLAPDVLFGLLGCLSKGLQTSPTANAVKPFGFVQTLGEESSLTAALLVGIRAYILDQDPSQEAPKDLLTGDLDPAIDAALKARWAHAVRQMLGLDMRNRVAVMPPMPWNEALLSVALTQAEAMLNTEWLLEPAGYRGAPLPTPFDQAQIRQDNDAVSVVFASLHHRLGPIELPKSLLFGQDDAVADWIRGHAREAVECSSPETMVARTSRLH